MTLFWGPLKDKGSYCRVGPTSKFHRNYSTVWTVWIVSMGPGVGPTRRCEALSLSGPQNDAIPEALHGAAFDFLDCYRLPAPAY